jgi:acetyl CoA:N6-hydroxylysine acetyl transferase
MDRPTTGSILQYQIIHAMTMTSPFTSWCKAKPAPELLYDRFFDAVGTSLQFRSFDLNRDLHLIHEWVNMDYTRTFWQMRGSIGLLRACYQCIQQNPFAHSFIGLYGQSPVCQFDIYQVAADELAHHVDYEPADTGFHLLMAPSRLPVHQLTVTLVSAFLDFYFSHPGSGKMFAEPDIQNLKSIDLLRRSGFTEIKTIEMSYKTAHVYSLTKDQFNAKN